MVKLHEPEPTIETKCVELATERLPIKKMAHIVADNKEKRPDDKVIRYNRDTLIAMKESNYSLTKPQYLVDALAGEVRWNIDNSICHPRGKNKKLPKTVETSEPQQQNNTRALQPRSCDVSGIQQANTSDLPAPLQSAIHASGRQGNGNEGTKAGNMADLGGSLERDRRIGSGRIPTSGVTHDFRPSGGLMGLRDRNSVGPMAVSNASAHGTIQSQLPAPQRSRFDRTDFWSDRFDRRTAGRDFERDRSGSFHRNDMQNGRYLASKNIHGGADGRNVYTENRGHTAEDPEWFSCGPISRHDTIELRGFDEPEPDEADASNVDRNSIGDVSKSGARNVTFADEEEDANYTRHTNNSNYTSPPPAMSTPTKKAFDRKGDNDSRSGTAEKETPFSRWFNATNLNGNNKNCRTTKEFFDISQGMHETGMRPITANALLDLLQRGPAASQLNNQYLRLQQLQHQRQQLPLTGKVYNVDDIEEHMRAGHVVSQSKSARIQSVAELETQFRSRNNLSDVRSNQNASNSVSFKQLFGQDMGRQSMAVQQNAALGPHQLQQSAVGLMQMLTTNMRQRQHTGTVPTYEQLRAAANPMNHMTAHQQMLYQQKIQQQMQIHQHQLQQRELMNMPANEQQALFQYLSQGEVTQQSLLQKLTNPTVASSERHLILAALRLTCNGVRVPQQTVATEIDHSGSAPITPPAAEAAGYVAKGTDKHKSHLTGTKQRMPSPRELKVHTESIMQGAMIKKKLEEQREFLRRQEWHFQQQQQQQQQTTVDGIMAPNRSLSLDPNQSLTKKSLHDRKSSPFIAAQNKWSDKLIDTPEPQTHTNADSQANHEPRGNWDRVTALDGQAQLENKNATATDTPVSHGPKVEISSARGNAIEEPSNPNKAPPPQ